MIANPNGRALNGSASTQQGPDPSTIHVARPYYFEQIVQDKMKTIGSTEAKEIAIRIQGVTWIDNVRKQLQLPVRTYNTACVYYHKFRLEHPDNEYHYYDAAAAALFNACKIEDTLKKSRDILCAAWNMRVSPSEHLSSDDPAFENHAKTIVGLERLMLEASGFDFRNRYPQRMLLKFVKSCDLGKDTVGVLSYKILLDLYRTFAPLKQTSQTMALACLELAIRLQGIDLATVKSDHAFDYIKWSTTREEIMETLADLLDLYTNNRSQTVVGPDYAIEKFLSIRITLNQESQANDYPRYTEWKEVEKSESSKDKGDRTKPSPQDLHRNGSVNNSKPVSPQSPATGPGTVGERGKEGTLRFMLDPERARDEKNIVNEYFRTEEIEEEVEIEVYIDPHTNEIMQSPHHASGQEVSMSISSKLTSCQSTPSNPGSKESSKDSHRFYNHKRKIEIPKDLRASNLAKPGDKSRPGHAAASPPTLRQMKGKLPKHSRSRVLSDDNNPNKIPLTREHNSSSLEMPYRQPPRRRETLPSNPGLYHTNQNENYDGHTADYYGGGAFHSHDDSYRSKHRPYNEYSGYEYHPSEENYGHDSYDCDDYYDRRYRQPSEQDNQAYHGQGLRIRGGARSANGARRNSSIASIDTYVERSNERLGHSTKQNDRGRNGDSRARSQKRNKRRATHGDTQSK